MDAVLCCQIERAEAAGIAGGFKNTGGIANSGITVAGTKYFFLQGDDKQIQCKKGLNGLSLGKSCQCKLYIFTLVTCCIYPIS